MKFWAHTIAFAFIAAFAITELGLTIHWRAVLIDGATGSYASRTDYLIFCAAWTVFGLLLHWAMTFAIANAWAILTCILWFIAGCVASSANCTSFYWWWRVCFSSVPEWRAIEAFAWLSFIAFIALPFCLWSDVKRCDMDWMDGIYGRNFIGKRKKGVQVAGISPPVPTTDLPPVNDKPAPYPTYPEMAQTQNQTA